MLKINTESNGLKDWLMQRISAVYFAGYSLYLWIFLLTHHGLLQYSQWHALFHHISMQIASIIAILMLILHGWIGIWTVSTDYLRGTALRTAAQLIVIFLLLALFIWAVMIIWRQ